MVFEQPPHNADEPEPDVTAGIAEFLPFAANTEWVRIRHDGVVVAEMVVSANSPEVQFESPQSGALASGQMLRWQGSDADGDALYYTLAYSPDDGATWQPLLVNSPLTEIEVTADMLHAMPGSTQGRLKIIASDGVNTAEDAADGLFTVPDSAPDVLILSPEDETIAPVGSYVSFSATAFDVEDHDLPEASLKWTSSLDGALGQGPLLDTDDLSPGRHTITFSATDGDGMTGQASVEVVIQPPTLYLPRMRR